jgi:hypothetical protein
VADLPEYSYPFLASNRSIRAVFPPEQYSPTYIEKERKIYETLPPLSAIGRFPLNFGETANLWDSRRKMQHSDLFNRTIKTLDLLIGTMNMEEMDGNYH